MCYMLSLDVDVRRSYTEIDFDRILFKIKGKLYGLRAPRIPSAYRAPIVAISEQQIALPVAIAIRANMVRRYMVKGF